MTDRSGAFIGQQLGAANLITSAQIAALGTAEMSAYTSTAISGLTTTAMTGFVSGAFQTTAMSSLTSTAHTYTAPLSAASQALTDAATVSIAITKQIWTLTTAAARTIAAPTGGVAGTTYRLVLTTGGYTPSWNTIFKWPAAAAPSSLTGLCIFDFYYDGTNFNNVGQSLAVA